MIVNKLCMIKKIDFHDHFCVIHEEDRLGVWVKIAKIEASAISDPASPRMR